MNFRENKLHGRLAEKFGHGRGQAQVNSWLASLYLSKLLSSLPTMDTLRKQLPAPLGLYARLLVAAIFLYHGLPKAIYWSWASENFTNMGLPAFLGPLAGIIEVVGGLALAVGVQLRFFSLVLIAVMLGAIATVQAPNAIAQGAFICGLERDLLIIGLCGYLFIDRS